MIASQRRGRHEGAAMQAGQIQRGESTAGGPSLTMPVVVGMPAEIDIANVDVVRAGLADAVEGGAALVVADLTATTFCDSSGLRELLLAHQLAVEAGGELRLAAAEDGAVLRVLRLIGLDRVLPVSTSVAEAVAGSGGT
jgi:anti-sigma B factor antagonist